MKEQDRTGRTLCVFTCWGGFCQGKSRGRLFEKHI